MDWNLLLSQQRLGSTASGQQNRERSAFEVDYDRIIFSAAFRKLQDKTQVFPLPKHDFVHTRLTHSLEVSSVGRSLGKYAGNIILDRHPALKNKITSHDISTITAVASLAHDIGNPPFGHSGEKAISEFFMYSESGKHIENLVTPETWQEITEFEGNAQGFRVLTRSENQSLKLTFASLGAFSKYPCAAGAERSRSVKAEKKYGYFSGEAQAFHEVFENLGVPKTGDNKWVRHPLVYLTEAADDICYHIIDLEDAVGLGLIPLHTMMDLLEPLVHDRIIPDKFNRIPSKKSKAGLLRAMSINKLIDQTVEVFADIEPALLKGSWNGSLADKIKDSETLSQVGDFSFREIYRSRQVLDVEIAGFEVIQGILAAYMDAFVQGFSHHKSGLLTQLMPEDLAYALKNEEDADEKVHLILDFVSGMTDRAALSFYRNMKGIEIINEGK